MNKQATKEETLPDGWRWVKLGDVCKQDRQIVEPYTKDSESLPYYSLEHIESETGRMSKNDIGQIEDVGKSITFRFDNRHVLYGKLRPYLNKVALPNFAGRCTTEMIPLLPNHNVERTVLAWILRKQETVDFAMQEKTGSRMPRANMNSLLSLEVPLPPLPEQKRIATILKEQMAAVENARAAAQTRLETIKALPAAFLRQIFPQPDQPLPEGWLWVKLGDVCDFIRGVTFDKSEVSPFSDEGRVPILRAGNIGRKIDTINDLVWVPNQNVTSDQFVRVGDSVICMSSGSASVVGKTALVDCEWRGSVGAFCGIIRPSNHTVDNFLNFWFQSRFFLDWRDEQARGANIQNLRFSQLANLAFLLPPLLDQKRIAAILKEQMAAVEKSRTAAEEELNTINAIPAALLRRAFNGEL